MATLILLYPLVYWYFTVPELLYILFAIFRNIGRGMWPMLYFSGLMTYYFTFAFVSEKGTMIVTAIIIVIDFILYLKGRKNGVQYEVYLPPEREWDPLDITNPYNDCPECGGPTDGNDCDVCDGEF